MNGADFTCGSFLDYCTCSGPISLSPAGMLLRHEASVARAKRRDAGHAPTVEVSPNMHGRQISARRAQQRATADAPTLRDILTRRAS